MNLVFSRIELNLVEENIPTLKASKFLFHIVSSNQRYSAITSHTEVRNYRTLISENFQYNEYSALHTYKYTNIYFSLKTDVSL